MALNSIKDIVLRSVAQRRVSKDGGTLPGALHHHLWPSFETPRYRAAPQDEVGIWATLRPT
jgi:hypothetical protein